jgi:hypothetical protein
MNTPGAGLSAVAAMLALSALACGSESGEAPAASNVDPPLPGEGVRRIELTAGNVPPGQEITLCEYLEPLAEDLHVTRYETYQDSGGHHLALYKWLGEPKPAGLVEDCQSGEAMGEMLLALTPITAPEDGPAYVQFPERNALRLHAGTPLVAQYHYINTTAQPLPFRDVAHLTLADPADVDRIVHTYALGSTDFVIAPQQTTTEGFSCEIPFELTPILQLPHMHEYGSHFLSEVVSGTDERSLIEVVQWEAGMRDIPPIRDYLSDAEPTVFRPGDQIRVFCTWDNPSPDELRFPLEMCASVAYFWSDAEDAGDILCTGTNKVQR